MAIGLCVALLSGVQTDAATVKSIVGVNSDVTGFVPIPSVFSSLCVAGCPQGMMPSFTDPLRLWGRTGTSVGSCTTSVDGGSTWAACTTQPFVGGTYQGREMYMGTADGSVVVITFDTTPTCEIKKSIDNGASWQTKFTFADRCGGPFFEGVSGWCLVDGRCEFQSWHSSATAVYAVFRSSNNGETWARGDTATDTGNQPAGSVWDGSIGMMPLTQTTVTGGAYSSPAGDAWSKGASAFTSFGDCWGAVILSNVPYAMCANGTVYTLRDRTGTTFKTPTFSPNPLFNVDSGGVSFAYSNSVIYTLVTLTGAGHMGLYISQDAGSSFAFVADVATNGLRGGTMWKHPLNGCIYWDVTGGGSSKVGKACR